ncbi:MAG TPA: hypothetical protein VK974_08640 [Methylophilaceae bacterium]|nr:hypothetical protein [Methylophilaceae bacterium]
MIHQKTPTIYQKTAAGIAEIAAAERKLNFRQRQALILVDGKRNIDEIAVFLNQHNMPEMLIALEQLGYIYNPASPARQIIAYPSQAAESANGVSVMSEAQVQSIKDILIHSIDQHLGIMGRSLKQKIEAAATDEQIIACSSQWHMAMRESKLGREVAGALMEQVQQTLKAGID